MPALDSTLTGGLANTRVTSERTVFSSTTAPQPVVFKVGCAYWTDIEVSDYTNSTTLVKDVDYVGMDTAGIPSKLTGQPVYNALVVTKPGVIGVDVSYSTPTDFATSSDITNALSALLQALLSNSRSVWWENVLNRPEVFNPVAHRQNLAKATGYEYLINTLDQLIKVMILGDELGHDKLRAYIDNQCRNHFNSLVAEYNNIHNSTVNAAAAITTRFTSMQSTMTALSAKIDALIANQTTYQSTLSNLPASVTASQDSANTWLSGMAF